MIQGKNLVQIIIDTNDDVTPEAKKAAVDYLASLREAGGKMAERLRLNKKLAEGKIKFIDSDLIFTANDADALEAWGAANK